MLLDLILLKKYSRFISLPSSLLYLKLDLNIKYSLYYFYIQMIQY